MKLLIVIPALNEEASIESIIERSLAARSYIEAYSPVTVVEITVVSDGSTDRTVELASRYRDSIRLIVFERNRGYGAAIQTAWQESNAELLGFLDADGTCEPKFFANLCKTLVDEKADVVLGCRLNKDTKMPLIRQIGNLLFAALLTLFSQRRVRDTASGMRVIKREAYARLRPLPNGLHFTPAMSARALLGAGGTTKLVEIDMPYHEREGESKLHVVKDGLRFLRIITETAFLYKPGRILSQLAAVLLIIAALTAGVSAVSTSARHISAPAIAGMIVSGVAFLFSLLLLSTSSAMQLIADSTIGGTEESTRISYRIHKAYTSSLFWIIPFLLVVVSFVCLQGIGWTDHPGDMPDRFLTGALTAGFLLLTGIVLVIGRVFAYFLDLLLRQLQYTRQMADPIRTQAPETVDITVTST